MTEHEHAQRQADEARIRTRGVKTVDAGIVEIRRLLSIKDPTRTQTNTGLNAGRLRSLKSEFHKGERFRERFEVSCMTCQKLTLEPIFKYL